MRTFVLILLLLAPASAGAQWLHYPTPGIPRTAEGKPLLTASTPHTADGTPDLSGLWRINGLEHIVNITDAEMRSTARALFEARGERYGADDPIASCLPEGPRAGLAGLAPLRLIQTPGLAVVLYEGGSFRQIFSDGRPLPTDPNPSWMGYSIGRWDGDTFVVETTGYNDRTWLDMAGHPHSDALHLTERFRRIDFGHMQLVMTFDDAKSYTKPFTIVLSALLAADDDLIEMVCLENEKDRAKLVGSVQTDNDMEVPPATSLLSELAGRYNVGPFGTWIVVIDGDRLAIELPNGPRLRLVAKSPTAFVSPVLGTTLSFVREHGVVTHFLLMSVEGDIQANRKP